MWKKVVKIVLILAVVLNSVIAKSCPRKQSLFKVGGGATMLWKEEDDEPTIVKLTGQVTVNANSDHVELRVVDLLITGPDGQIRENPPGLDEPVSFDPRERSTVQPTLNFGEDHNFTSHSIKKAIVEILSQDISVQEETSLDLSQIQTTIDLIKEGDEKIILSDEYKNVILVLGNTGAGKSTFTQWITENSNSLVAKEVVEGEFIIEDNLNKIGNSTIDSKTTFPELVIDEEANGRGEYIAYYDFPGFSDTRISSYDIASSYFIKKTIDHADGIKMIFVVSYPSVRKGVDRQDFLKLLRHISELVKDFDIFSNSVALVVTKVDNQYVFKNGVPTIISDSTIIGGIANFLQEAKQDLEQRIQDASVSDGEKMYYENAVKFITALLTTDGFSYQRIALFRRPLDEGVLSDSDMLVTEKKNIKDVVLPSLNYAFKDTEDIGRTISDRSKNDLNNMAEKIERNIFFTICALTESIQYSYNRQIDVLKNKINSIDINITSDALNKIEQANTLIMKLSEGYNATEEIAHNMKALNDIVNVSRIINETVVKFNITNLNEVIFTQVIYLKLLRNLSGEDSNTHISLVAWASSFLDLLPELAVSRDSIQRAINVLALDIDHVIQFKFEAIGKEIKAYYSLKESNYQDLQQLYDVFLSGLNVIPIRSQIMNVTSPHEYLKQTETLFDNVNITMDDEMKLIVIKHVKYFALLKNEIDCVLKYLKDSQNWYAFLKLFYIKLTKLYELPTSELDMLVKNITKIDEGIMIAETNLDYVLRKVFPGDTEITDVAWNSIQNITLDKFKQSHLRNVISVALNKADHYCDSGNLVIRGLNVKLSMVGYITCPDPIETILVFALNRIFIDKSINGRGKHIHVVIIAPTWEIIGDPKIILDGLDGKEHYPEKASNGHDQGSKGEDGKPGLSGDSGGNFIGIGEKFINHEKLTISSNGGNGGPGQIGGDGARGTDGTVPHIYNPKQYLIDHGLYNNKHEYTWYFMYCEWEILGSMCSNGGDSGRGGHGGYGGKAGVIDINTLSFQGNLRITLSDKRGSFGRHGYEGQPGWPGKSGGIAKINWAPLRVWDHTRVEYSDLPGCSLGEHAYGHNTLYMQEPSYESYLNKKLIILEYLSYLNAYDSVNKEPMRKFRQKILDNGF